MFDEQRRMLVDAFTCDAKWMARISNDIPDEARREEIAEKRNRIRDEFVTSLSPVFLEYGRIWDRLGDLDIEDNPFVIIEDAIFKSVGIASYYPSGISMLEKTIRLFKREAEERMTIRQFEYVFNTHLDYE